MLTAFVAFTLFCALCAKYFGIGTSGAPGAVASQWRKVSITNAQIVALGAVLNGDITLFTLAANEILENIIVVVTSPGGGTTALTMAVGKTGALYIDCIVASDVKTAAINLGVLAAQRGLDQTAGGDIHALTSATYKAHFISTIQNLSAVIGFACDVHYKVGTMSA